MSDDGLERIWTPHRMAYVRTAVADEGCPFCAIPGHPDDESLATGALVTLALGLLGALPALAARPAQALRTL